MRVWKCAMGALGFGALCLSGALAQGLSDEDLLGAETQQRLVWNKVTSLFGKPPLAKRAMLAFNDRPREEFWRVEESLKDRVHALATELPGPSYDRLRDAPAITVMARRLRSMAVLREYSEDAAMRALEAEVDGIHGDATDLLTWVNRLRSDGHQARQKPPIRIGIPAGDDDFEAMAGQRAGAASERSVPAATQRTTAAMARDAGRIRATLAGEFGEPPSITTSHIADANEGGRMVYRASKSAIAALVDIQLNLEGPGYGALGATDAGVRIARIVSRLSGLQAADYRTAFAIMQAEVTGLMGTLDRIVREGGDRAQRD